MNEEHEEDRRARLFLIAFVLAILTACLAAVGFNAEADPITEVQFAWSGDTVDREAQIERFVNEWFSTCSPRKRTAALQLVPDVVAASQSGDVNPALVAAIVSYESTWKPESVGKLGELGLMQVGDWHGAPLDTPRAQLDAGISILRSAYEKCGTVAGALSYYATGRSCRVYHGARLRLRLAAHIESL